MIESLFKTPVLRVVGWTIVVGGLACPGMLTIAAYLPDFFAAHDTIKLLFLAIGAALPVYIVNVGLSFCDDMTAPFESTPASDRIEHRMAQAAFAGGLFSLFPLYVPALMILVLGRAGSSLRISLLALAFAEVTVVGMFVFSGWRARRAKRAAVRAATDTAGAATS